MDGPGNESVLSSLQGPLRAIGSVVLPSSDVLDEEGWKRAERIIEGALAPKPAGIKRQIRLFLRLVNVLPILSTGRTLTKLPLEKRAGFLRRLHRSPLMPLRRGMWGIRTLLFMGYYNQDQVRAGIGYAADPRGWAAHCGDPLREGDEGSQGRNERDSAEAGGNS